MATQTASTPLPDEACLKIATGQGAAWLAFSPVTAAADMNAETMAASRHDLFQLIEKYFFIVAETLVEIPAMQRMALEHLQEAKERLRDADADPYQALSQAQYLVHLVHAKIAKQQANARAELGLQRIIIVLLISYLIILVGGIIIGSRFGLDAETTLPLLNIPLGLVIWAGVGSFTSILYRYYTHQLQSNVSNRLRWLVVRPVVGIIMGVVIALALQGGLFLLDANPESSVEINMQVLSLFAFLGGFSDRLFEGILDSIVGRFAGATPENKTAPATEA